MKKFAFVYCISIVFLVLTESLVYANGVDYYPGDSWRKFLRGKWNYNSPFLILKRVFTG